MKKDKSLSNEDHILQEINLILTTDIRDDERSLLIDGQHALEKKQYFPRIVSRLQGGLTPLAVSRKMSESVKGLYLELMKFSDKGFGGGLFTVWGTSF